MKVASSRISAVFTISSLSFSTISVSSSLSVSDLAAKPFVQRSMASPNSPTSVLSFFFGVDYASPDHDYKIVMRDGTPLQAMNNIWYGGGDEYDMMCKAFVPVIRSVVVEDPKITQERNPEEYKVWNDSIDGLMSQVLLCDQLSRNAFRGTEHAFEHDSTAEKQARQLVHDFLKDNPSTQSVPGEFFPPYVSFMVTALMHSENIENHRLAAEVLKTAVQRFHDREAAKNSLQFQVGFLEEHRSVLERFGRYPHRNSKLDRENTAEEHSWLNDKENLPNWAKSQG
jgi:uncharacterized protein (DUF924 family)